MYVCVYEYLHMDVYGSTKPLSSLYTISKQRGLVPVLRFELGINQPWITLPNEYMTKLAWSYGHKTVHVYM